MRHALALAERAAAQGEVPVGAVAVHQGKVVGEAHNLRESQKDPFAHAEVLALAQASRALRAWRLTGVTLYVTLEPCAMCAGAIIQGRVDRVVFGASDPKAGAVGSLYNLLADERHNHRPAVEGGFLAEESSAQLSAFFRARRR
jgi:tRNA(adenine34) deaminase